MNKITGRYFACRTAIFPQNVFPHLASLIVGLFFNSLYFVLHNYMKVFLFSQAFQSRAYLSQQQNNLVFHCSYLLFVI